MLHKYHGNIHYREIAKKSNEIKDLREYSTCGTQGRSIGGHLEGRVDRGIKVSNVPPLNPKGTWNMKITNKIGLPEALIDGIVAIRGEYNRGDCDFTATQLSKPPMMVRLERDHHSELEADAIDMLWSIFGSAFHLIASRGASSARGEISELRLTSVFAGKNKNWVISGQADLYSSKEKTIYDYKTTSPWVMVFNPDGQVEWEQQLNVLAVIYRRNNYEVKKIKDVLLFRGWSSSEAKRNPQYPKEKAMVLPQKMWSEEQVNSYIIGRCELFDNALRCPDVEIGKAACPPCSNDEKWCRNEGWAVQKIGRQRARKVFKPDKLSQANELAEELGNLYVVLPRYGRRVRCEEACLVSKWCPDWRDYQERIRIAAEEDNEDSEINIVDWDKNK